jgi:hypothetical protein
MIRSRVCFALLVIAAGPALHAARYRLQSNPWVNLHQRLLCQAAGFEALPPPAGLSPDEVVKWNGMVDSYRSFLAKRSPIVDEELIAMNTALSATAAAKLPDSIPKVPKGLLETAMPLYRVAQWEEDDRVNRFWIAVAEPLLASAGEELAEAHAKAYGVPFPKHILVDVTSCGWEFGAYTVGEGESAHSVIASPVSGTQGFAALEILLHEPSHAIVAPRSGAIGADLARISKELGIRPYSYLWHAILFYTSGELTRQALARRGVVYQPIILAMYDRGFRGFRKPLETHWQAYLDGKVTRDEAIRQIVIETAPPPRK